MLLRETVRIFTQHRTLYCYFCLSLWIFLLIAGMYKYISNGNIVISQSLFSVHQYNYVAEKEVEKLQKFQSNCNPLQTITRKEDGGVLNGWKLQGVLAVIRHGDRGPMGHVRSINSIDCSGGHQTNVLLNKYRSFLANTTFGSPLGFYVWNKNGPFHNFHLLPAFPKSCLLGQLTYSGVAQLLQVGDIFRQVYGHPLGLLTKPLKSTNPFSTNSSGVQSYYFPDEVIVYSTRYRRTFQSAMALMFAFLPTERWFSLSIRESHSLSFCFADCACPLADQIKTLLDKHDVRQLNQHSTIAAVVQWIGSILLQNPTSKMQPLEVRDAILSVICHNAPLPCRRNIQNDLYNANSAEKSVPMSTTEEANDLINIDQDDNNNNNNAINRNNIQSENLNRILETESGAFDADFDGCVEASHISALMSYIQWQSDKESRSNLRRREGLLRAYGLIRHIVQFMLKIVSGDKTKFVLYSGHDRTLQFLMAALDLKTTDSSFVPYAARMAFEVYKSEAGTGESSEFYFRLVSNGRDITRQISFCEGGRSLRISKDSRGNKADLCPIENIIRFIHDDYFASFNVTNFKDACLTHKLSEM